MKEEVVGSCAARFKIRQLNPCGRFEETNLHLISELRELVARKMEKIILASVGIP